MKQVQKVAHLIRDDNEALDVAARLAELFAQEASARDRDRVLPVAEIQAYSASGLLGAIVPKRFGGAAISNVTLSRVTATISEADSSIGQIPQPHYCLVDAVRIVGTPIQQETFFADALAGKLFGNAVSEVGKDYETSTTTLKGSVLNGRKFYSTGSLFADWVPIAAKDDHGKAVMVYVPAEAIGLSVLDDWTGMGQRTTASGSVVAENVEVQDWQVLARHRLFDEPTIHGPFAQLLHTAIDLGIARAAMSDLRDWVQKRARPWKDSGVNQASSDPLTTTSIGRMVMQLHAAEGMLDRAGGYVDEASANPSDVTVGEASVAVAEAKVLATELALAASSMLFELAGTQSSLEEHNLARHWRNARTHTLHDPVRWKPHVVGSFWLNNALPPRHGSV
ncbi:MAG: SfnB family sulfur acquisition oxidoreductase [Hyphomicrobiales bacterium]|uniref:SfnB family sulfur acquisition oxidoreductase n=1 Tax=Alphaproteobacteria TaxID=28211 RepID=UPI0032634890